MNIPVRRKGLASPRNCFVTHFHATINYSNEFSEIRKNKLMKIFFHFESDLHKKVLFLVDKVFFSTGGCYVVRHRRGFPI
jgi:hypothetical protein